MVKTLINHMEFFKNWLKQAGAVLGQAQLKLGMDFTSINLQLMKYS